MIRREKTSKVLELQSDVSEKIEEVVNPVRTIKQR